jgi:hypothetical protein
LIEDPAPNAIARPYRGLSVREVDMPLTEPDLTPFLLGRLAEPSRTVGAADGPGGQDPQRNGHASAISGGPG